MKTARIAGLGVAVAVALGVLVLATSGDARG